MLRRDHLKGLGAGGLCLAGIVGFGILSKDEEEDESTPIHERSFDDLQDGDWHANVQFESPVDGLEANVHEAGSMPQGSLQSTIEIEGGFQYSESDVVTIRGMELKWMMGDSAIVDDATVSFDSDIALSNDESCDQLPHSDFDVAVSASSIQGADRLVITIPQSDVSTSTTC